MTSQRGPDASSQAISRSSCSKSRHGENAGLNTWENWLIRDLRVASILGMLTFLPAGCTQDSQRATKDSAAEEAAPTVEAEEIWRSSERLLLSSVIELAVDSQGRVYLADRAVGVILLSSTGDSLRSIGRKGGGPGEYEFISRLQVIDRDSLLIFDSPARRISVFEPDSGTFAYAHTLHRLPERQWIREIARAHGEAPYVAVFPSPPEQSGGPQEGQSVVHLLDEEGRIVRDSLLVFSPGEDLVVTQESGDRIQASFHLENPFGWQPTVRLKEDRIYYGRSDSLAIHIYDLQGNRIGGFSKLVTPRPVSDKDVEREIGWMRDQGFSDQLPDRVREQWIKQLEAKVPENWAVYRTFLVDERGRIWLWPMGFQDDTEGSPHWRIYSADGSLLAKVTGVRAFPQAFADGKAYSVTHDSLGVPTVVVYRIPNLPFDIASVP